MKKYLYSVLVLAIFAIGFSASDDSEGSSNTDMLEKEVKQMMIDEMQKKGQTLKVGEFTLVHQEGNKYTGLAKCTLDGEQIDLDVDVVYDGKKFQAEWAPTAEYQAKVIEEGLNDLFNE